MLGEATAGVGSDVRTAGDPLPTTCWSVLLNLSSDHPVSVAGRHLIATRSDRIEGIDLARLSDYTPSFRGDISTFQVKARLPSDSVYRPVFASPHLYWMRDGRIERVNTRTDGTPSPETVAAVADTALTSEPAVGRTDAATYLVWPLRDHLAVVTLDAHNRPVTEAAEQARRIDASPQGRWHTPVFDPTSRRWAAVDTAGRAILASSDREPAPGEDLPFSRVSLVPEGTTRVSPPRQIGAYVFVAYWTSSESGLARLHLPTASVVRIQPDRVSMDLAAPASPPPPAALGDEGVLWPASESARAFFAPVGGTESGTTGQGNANEESQGRWMPVHNASAFRHRHAICVDGTLYNWEPVPDASASSTSAAGMRVVRYERGQRELTLSVVARTPEISARDAQRLVFAPGFPGQPAAVVAQGRDRIAYVYGAS
jgi:hypothetical protein